MSSSSSYPPVVPPHCSNVPVLFELLKGEEEPCRVWLRAEMNQIPEPLIDSLFHELIFSSSCSSVVPQSSLNVSELCELLEGKKVQVRSVLRDEMDRLVNALFERLNNKLVMKSADLDRSEDGGGDRVQVGGNLLVQVESPNPQSQQPSSPIAQPSTADGQTEDGEMMEIAEEVEVDAEGGEARFNNIDAGLTEDKNQGGNDETRFVENASSMDTTTSAIDSIGQSQKQVIVNQSTRVVKRVHREAQVRNDVNNGEGNEEGEDKDEVDDDTNDVREGITQGMKRARTSQRPSATTQELHVLTVTLRCDQVGCGEIEIAKDKFSPHMWNRHSIGANPCLVKDCVQSFNDPRALSGHRAQSHQHLTQWNCSKCAKQYSTYPKLSTHYMQHHQLGQFQCSFSGCTFTADCKVKVYTHQNQHRTAKQTVNCSRPGCFHVAPNVPKLQQHMLEHLKREPYLCKWPQCLYASATRAITLAHIRSVHLGLNGPTDPNDYLHAIL